MQNEVCAQQRKRGEVCGEGKMKDVKEKGMRVIRGVRKSVTGMSPIRAVCVCVR